MNGWSKCGVYAQWIIIHSQKWENSAIYDMMNGPWGHYGKWNMWYRERRILCILICGIKKKAKLIKREYNDDYQRLGVRELERDCLRIQNCN